MACRIERNPQGKILRVFDPQGNESSLFKQLAKVPGNTLEKALEQYLQTLEPELRFEVEPINNGLTSHMFVLGDEVIGTIRTRPYKDGVKIDQVSVKPAYQKQGIGTELYLETTRNLMIEGKKLYSDNARTEGAEKIWQNLVRLRLATKNNDGTYETVEVPVISPDTTIDAVIDTLKGNAVTLTGERSEGEIVAYNSEVGNIYYSLDSEGEMQMVRPMYQIIGQTGAENLDRLQGGTVMSDNLQVAQQMQSQGKTPKEIRLSTGWELGADNMWKYEIQDVKTKDLEVSLDQTHPFFTENVGVYKLTDIVEENNEVFQAYPNLKDVNVIFTTELGQGVNMEYQNNNIYINYYEFTEGGKFVDRYFFTQHEIQHYIQQVEGFARGGSPFEFTSRIERVLNDVMQGRDVTTQREGDNATFNRAVEELFYRHFPTGDIGEVGIQNIIAGISEIMYTRLSGEVEARNIQKRAGYTQQQRQRETLQFTEDVARERQLVFQTKGEQFNSYKEALMTTYGEDIQIGFVKDGEFQALETRNSSTDPTVELGWINNAIKENIVNDEALLEDGEVYLEVAGTSVENQVTNDEIIKQFAYENGFKAELRPDGTFQLRNLTPIEDFPAKKHIEGIYQNFFRESQTQEVFVDTDSQLVDKIMTFLEKIGFSVTTIEAYIENYSKKNGVPPNAEALVDLANQVVAFKEGRITEETLTEEFAHIMLEAVPQEGLENMLRNVHNTKEWAEHSQAYMDIYQDEALVRKEILGKIVAKGLQNKTESLSFFQEAWNLIRDFINSIIRPGYINEMDRLTDRVHDMLVRQDIGSLEDLSKRKFRLYRVDNTLPELTNQALRFIETAEQQVRSSGSNQYLLREALENLKNKRVRLATVNTIDLVRRMVRYVTTAIDSAKNEGMLLSGEERIVALNLKETIQPIITKMRERVKDDPELRDLYDTMRDLSDDIVRIDINPTPEMKNRVIDRVMNADPNLTSQDRADYETAFEEADRDTNFLFSMVGLGSHAKDKLVSLLIKVVETLTARAGLLFHNDAQKITGVLRRTGLKVEDINKMQEDGFYISYWNWAEHKKRVDEIENKILEELGVKEGEELTADQESEFSKRRKEEIKKSGIEVDKYNQDYYDELEKRMGGLSDITKQKLEEFGRYRAEIMRNVKRDSKGRPVYSKRNREELEAYNIERRKQKNIYDSNGILKEGLEFHLTPVEGSVESFGGHITLNTSRVGLDGNPLAPSPEAIVAYEMTKLDLEQRGSFGKNIGIKEFTDTLTNDMSVDQVRELVLSNINFGQVYDEFVEQEVPNEADPEDYSRFKVLMAQRRQILGNYRDPKNPSNTMVHKMNEADKQRVRELTDDISTLRKKIWKEQVVGSTGEYGTNDSWGNHISDLGLTEDKEIAEEGMKHIPSVRASYVRSLFDSLRLAQQGYEITPLEDSRLQREFGEDYVDGDFYEMKRQAVERRLAPYFMSTTPEGVKDQMRKIREAVSVNQIKQALSNLESNPKMELSLHHSYYETEVDNTNPNYKTEFKGYRTQTSLINPRFNEALKLTPGSYKLDELGIPVMNDGSAGSNELQVYRVLMETRYTALKNQSSDGSVNLFLLPQISRSTTNKLMTAIGSPSQAGVLLKETLNEIKKFRIDELEVGELDKDGESLHKQGIRVVPRRFVRALENPEDVTDDIFYSSMLFIKESHLHKARKEAVAEMGAIEHASNNRKYNNTSKQAQQTNTAKLVRSMIDYNIFGITEIANYRFNVPYIGEVDAAKLARGLHKYVRNRNLGFNLIVPLTSWLTAEVGLIIEKYVKQYIDPRSINMARKELAKLSQDAFTEGMSVIKTGKLSVLAERSGLFDMESSYENSKYHPVTRFLGKMGYIAHTAANYSPIMQAMLSSFYGHRYHNGHFMTFDMYQKFRRTETPNLSEKQVKAEWSALENVNYYKYLHVSEEGQFNMLYDQLAKDAGITLEQAKEVLDRSEIEITIEAQKISQVIDGNVRPHERTMMQRHFLLSFLTTHKGWLSIALGRRFKSKHYNVTTKQWEEGTYVTGARQVRKLMSELVKGRNLKQFQDAFTETWANAQPHERQNLKRFLIELSTLTALYALYLGMAGFADDDDNEDNRHIQLSAYLMERLINETRSAQIGIGDEILNTIQDPVVGFKELMKTSNIFQMFDTDEVKRGRYQGMSGTSAYLLNTIPGGKSMHTLWSGENLNYQRRAYQHYNGVDELQPLSLFIDKADAVEWYNKK